MHRPFASRVLALLAFAALPGLAGAATLDLVADAVLGKPTLATPGAPASITGADLAGPGGAAEDPVTGALWVTDQLRHRVLRYASSAAFANGEAANLVLGQADFVSGSANRGGAVAANTLRFPYGVAVDETGRLYVADAENHRVLVFHPPHASGMNATVVLGQATFAGGTANRGGAVAANTLFRPLGIALDRLGNLHVADSANHRVLRYAAPAVTGANATKVYGQAGSFTASGPSTTATGLGSPSAVAVDGADDVWVADRDNNRVLRYTDGATGANATANTVLCQATFTTSAGGSTATTCSQPLGVAVDTAGAVYVADLANHRVLRYTSVANGAAATGVAGQASFTANQCNQGVPLTPSASSLCSPGTLALDRAGNLLVADGGNNRLLRYDVPLGRAVPSIAGLSPAMVPFGSPAITLTLNGSGFHGASVANLNGQPLATQYLSSRRLLAQIPAGAIAGGPFSFTVTTPGPGGGTSGAAILSAYTRAPLDGSADRVLGQPALSGVASSSTDLGEERLGVVGGASWPGISMVGLALDPVSGRVFATDRTGSRVLSWPSVTSFHNAQEADVVLGQPDAFSNACNTGGLGAATLCAPQGLAVGPGGTLYVADTANHRVLRFAPPFSTGMAASFIFGQGGVFTTALANKGGMGPDSLNLPMAVAASATTLFIFDGGNRRILVYDNPAASYTAARVIGQSTLTFAIDEPASATRFRAEYPALAVDAAGRLYAALNLENRVLRFSPPFTNGMAADVVLGQFGFTSTGSGTSNQALSAPIGLAFDPAGNLLLVDAANHRILRFAAPIVNGMVATGVLGQANFTSATPGTTASGLTAPTFVAADWAGNVIVTDYGNARILAFDRPFAFAIDPAGDTDRDGIPNGIEAGEARDPFTKDNDVFGSTRLFAMQQYRDFLSREGDSGGIAFWIAQLAGPQTRAQAIQGFFNSPEFQGVIAPVARLYFANFLRYPDYVGLQFHVARSRTGTPLATIANDFATSPEFISRYGALTNDAFIELVYNNVLGRPSDPVGKAYWLAQMSGGATRGQVMLGFSESPEYVAAIGNEVFITMMYVGMLRRAPDPVGFPFWLTQLDGGTSSLALTQGFLDAPEYRGRFLP